MIYLLVSILIIVSFLCGLCEGVMDLLNFKFNETIFSNKSHQFWNKDISSQNKNVTGNWFKKLFFKTFGVFLTDGWHLFKSLHSFFLFCIILLSYIISNNIIIFVLIVLISYSFKKLIFEITYNKLFKK